MQSEWIYALVAAYTGAKGMGVNARPEDVRMRFASEPRLIRCGRKCRVRTVGAVVLTTISSAILSSLIPEDWSLKL